MRLQRLVLIGLLAFGCSRVPAYSAPARPDSLECAVAEALEIGYAKLGGDLHEGSVRLGKRIPRPPTGPPVDVEAPAGSRVVEDVDEIPLEAEIRVSREGSLLRIEVLSEREPDLASEVTGDASDDAQRIMVQCTDPTD